MEDKGEMKRLFILSIVLALVFSGCAMFKIAPSKTSTGYTYMSNINPEDISNGKYSLVFGEMIDPFTAVVFYYQPEKDRVFGAIYTYEQSKNELRLFRIWYVEDGVLAIFDRNDEKRIWEKKNLAELELSGTQVSSIMIHLLKLRADLKQEEKI